MNRLIFATLLALLCAVLPSPRAGADPIPLETFAAGEEISDAAISPDGRFLAQVRLVQDRHVVIVSDLRAGKPQFQPVLAGLPGKFDIAWCSWATKTRLLCGYRGVTSDGQVLYVATRLVGVDADGKNQLVLLQNSEVAGGQFQDRVIDWNPGLADTVLIEADESLLDAATLADLATGASIYGNTDSNGFPAVFELNVRTGRTHLLLHSHPPVRHYLTDFHGTPRVAWGLAEGTKTYQYFVRSASNDRWQHLLKYEAFAAGNLKLPVALDASDPNRAYAIGASEGRDALWSIDLSDRQDPQLVYANGTVDISEPILLKNGELLGVDYETDRPHTFYTTSRIEHALQQLDATLAETTNTIISCTTDQSLCIIRASSDVQPGIWYLFDTTLPKLIELGHNNPALDSKQLGRMIPISYPARDGTMIPGYLTTPPGQKAEHLPLIVMPHGGPIARDSWEYFFLQQFLVNRGYAVLQMNFRGSGGYGEAWYGAAHQDWGGLTYDDIVDGTRWAIQSGIADPNRVAIVGWSFGGYAALLGAVRNGELFRCAVSIAGISDLGLLLTQKSFFAEREVSREQIGTRAAKLAADSPRRHVDKVHVPILMLHGDRDPQVDVDQSRAMAKALKSVNKPFEYIELKGADHQMRYFEDRKIVLNAVEKFLSANMASQDIARPAP